MPSRLLAASLFVSVFAIHISYAQQIASDVAIDGASLHDGFGGGVCGVDGQVYRYPTSSKIKAIMRVSRDGSTLRFAFPRGEWPLAFAPFDAGLDLVTTHTSKTDGKVFDMYHFDDQANLLTQHRLSIGFQPSAVAVTFSGKTIVVGYYPEDSSLEDRKYGGAVLDADDQIIERFKLPLPPGGGGWVFDSGMLAGDDLAYVMLHSNERARNEGPKDALATVSEDGRLDIKLVSLPPDTEDRHHHRWLFGPGVAVEEYRYLVDVGEGKRTFWGFDEYDLRSGEKIATRSTVPAGYHLGCYAGEELSMLADRAHIETERTSKHEGLRLVTVKLMDGLTAH